MKLDKKVVIVTGASDGIGKQIALKLAKQHAVLGLLGRSEERLSRTADEAKKLGVSEVRIYPCDLRKEAEIVKTDWYPV